MSVIEIFPNSYLSESDSRSLIYNLKNGQIAVLDKNKIDISCENDKNNIQRYLQENNFFNNDNIEENFKKEFPQKIKFEQLYMIVTEACNLKCKYCRQEQPIEHHDMSIKDVENAVDKFLELSGGILKSIVFYGGEPLMNMEAVSHTIEYTNKKVGKVNYSIITNATLCTKEIAEYLANENVNVIVSIDGPEEMNDIARVPLRGKVSYKNAIRGYYYLKEAGCCIGTNSVIGPHNENNFEKLLNWIEEIKPNTVGFALPHGDKENFAMDVHFSNIYDRIINGFDMLIQKGISVIQVERKIKDIIQNNVNSFECRAAKNRLVACADGFFGVCEGAVTNRDFFSKNISEILPIAYKYQETSPLIISDCQSCIAKRICGGGCPYDKLMRYGKTNCADPYRCGFIKKVMIYGLNYIAKNIRLGNNESIKIITKEDRNELYQKLSFYKENFVPLDYNCDASVEK